MALYFPNNITSLKPGTRSNTKLRVSDGDSPAEHWLTNPDLPKLFDYEYGGDGQKEIAIAKGMIVAAGPKVAEFERGNRKVGTLVIANGFNKPIGMAPYNFGMYKPNGYFNLPSIVTREYVELPYFPNAADAAAVKWGAVHGALEPGDLLMVSPTNPGQMTKWDGQLTTITQICGQVLALEDEIEPFGWLKWALHPETARYEDGGTEGLNGQKKGLPNQYGYPYDPEYRKGTFETDAYLNPYTTNPTGITGLHDGAGKSQVPQQADIVVPMGAKAGDRIFVDTGKKNIIKGTLSVNFTNDPAQAIPETDTRLEIDYGTGRLFFRVDAALEASAALTSVTGKVNFRALFAGTPSGWDFAGATGAVRVLLKF